VENKKKIAFILLLSGSLIWGLAYIAQSISSRYLGAYTINFIKSLLGIAATLVMMFFFDRYRISKYGKDFHTKLTEDKLSTLKAGFICGTFMAFGTIFQQIGIAYTTVAKASFITVLYVVLVPVIQILMGRKQSKLILLCVLLSISGLYFLCFSGDSTFSKGELFVFLGAISYAFQILSLQKYAQETEGIRLSCVQFMTMAFYSLLFMIIFKEKVSWEMVKPALSSLLFIGLISSGIGFTFQILGQKEIEPSIASLIMCLESVWGALFGWLILKQSLSLREILGCVLVFSSVIIADLYLTRKN